jgi:photosystem II stability/assembly factor-like uncharacterized protein
LAGRSLAQQLTILNSGTEENLRGVSALASGVAWASGTHGTYLSTLDGGSTWTVAHVPQADDLDFRDVEAFSADLAYLLSAGPGERSRIYKTADGGKTWDLQFTNKDPKGFLDCMAFWDPLRGIVVGDPVDGRFTVLLTVNGGQSWTKVPDAALPPARDGEGAFAASGTCVAVAADRDAWFVTGGSAARVFHSQDGGKTWQATDAPIVHGSASAGIFSIAFRDKKHGMIAGGDYKSPAATGLNLAATGDGGKTWKLSSLSPQWYFSGVALLHGSPHTVVAVGAARSACAKKVGSNQWTKIWDQGLNAVSAFGPSSALAVGPKGLVVRLSDGK